MALLRLLVLGLVLGFLACVPAADASSGSTLFVQESSGGTLRKVAKDRYVLTVDPRGDMTAFTDRPARRVWRLGTSTFLSRWSLYGFAKVPPNAVLALDDAPASRDTLAVTLLSARPLRGGQVAYTVAPMRGEPGALAGYAKGADGLREGRLGPASLFVDNAGEAHTLYVATQSLSTGPGLVYTLNAQVEGGTSYGTPTTTVTGSFCPASFRWIAGRDGFFVGSGKACGIADQGRYYTFVVAIPMTLGARPVSVTVANQDPAAVGALGYFPFTGGCAAAFDRIPDATYGTVPVGCSGLTPAPAD
ncbi:MAG: hypothetical protein JHC95_21390 [Solirubrobacteraceae bacterium]|nr:hypothetical protein [Solirubrobacteraceae bacterium]